MTDRSAAHALATMTAALVEGPNVTDFMVHLLTDVAALLGVDDAAVLVALPDGSLDVLSATSHEATVLELYQAQHRSGPCVDAIRRDVVVAASSPVEVIRRWPDVGSRMYEIGYRSVCAMPMHWQGEAFAGVNLFSISERELDATELAILRTFADLATLAVVTPEKLDGAALADRIVHALDERVVVEQAKGVLAYRDHVDMAEAYRRLLGLASDRSQRLDEVARDVVESATRGGR